MKVLLFLLVILNTFILFANDTNQSNNSNLDYATLSVKPPIYYANLGDTKFERGDKRGAIEEFDKAIFLQPDYPIFYTKRAKVKFDLGNVEGAVEDYNKAISLKPDYANAFFQRSIIKSNRGDKKGALEDLNKVISISPTNADAYKNRAFIKKDLEIGRASCRERV